MKLIASVTAAFVLAGAGLVGSASAQAFMDTPADEPRQWAYVYQGNGSGPDPDGDTNPATNTRGFARIGSAAEAAFDPPYKVITFEAPPGSHGEKIIAQYAKRFGVTFSQGVARQVCEGQRYFRYDSACTYRRAPSGRFAAVYRDEWGRDLRVRFERPVCIAAMAIYPTGGKEGEEYIATIQPYAADGSKLARTRVRFNWTRDTFRWRLMAGAYMLGEKATRVDVNVESRDDRKKVVRFLIDDLAFVEDGCEEALAEIAAVEASTSKPAPPRDSDGDGVPDWQERRERREQEAEAAAAQAEPEV